MNAGVMMLTPAAQTRSPDMEAPFQTRPLSELVVGDKLFRDGHLFDVVMAYPLTTSLT